MRILLLVILSLSVFSGCLKTRAELGESEQENVYGAKAADNQLAAQQSKAQAALDQAAAAAPAPVPDEKDELIRGLNGRVEVLENQIQTITKDREEEKKQYDQKLTTLQEALTKLENELHPPPGEEQKNSKEAGLESSDESAQKAKGDKVAKNDKADKNTKKPEKKLSSLEAGEEYFAKQDWKKAILSFHQYTDETPKGKHVPDAKYKIGLCFQKLGMKEEAMAYFEEVAANYASTDAGKKSKTILSKLKK
jgi:TolA-binding protein